MKKWKPERRDGLLLLGIGLGAAVGLLRGAVLAWLPVGVALGLCLRGGAGTRSGSGKDRSEIFRIQIRNFMPAGMRLPRLETKIKYEKSHCFGRRHRAVISILPWLWPKRSDGASGRKSRSSSSVPKARWRWRRCLHWDTGSSVCPLRACSAASI